MSTGSRLAIVLATVVVLVVAFAALRPGDDDDPLPTPDVASTPADPPATTPTTSAPTQPQTATQPQTTTQPAEPAVPTIRVRGGRPVGGVRELEFESGDDIVFRVRSDVAEEIHVHGYDEYVQLRPDRTTTIRIEDAELEGVFEVELHGAGAPIAELRVTPS